MTDLNKFLSDNYDEIVLMALKITQDKEHCEVAHYAIEQFMNNPQSQAIVDRGEGMKFLSGIIYRNYHSSTSPYHKLYRQSGRVYATDRFQAEGKTREECIDCYGEDQGLWNPYSIDDVARTGHQGLLGKLEDTLGSDYDFEIDLKIEMCQGILEDMKAENMQQWYRAVLFEMWCETPNYSKIARATMIPRTSISVAVNEAQEYIIQKIEERNGFNN